LSQCRVDFSSGLRGIRNDTFGEAYPVAQIPRRLMKV